MKQIFALSLFSFVALVFAEAPADTSFQRFGGVPAVAYSEETGWQLGGLGMVFFRPTGPKDPGSQLDVAVIYTTRSQKRFVISSNINLMGGLVQWDLNMQYRDWPGTLWLGGNAPADSGYSYDMSMWQVNGDIQASLDPIQALPKLIRDKVSLGVQYDIELNHTAFKDDALQASVPKGGDRVGLGWVATWDGRDHDNWPRNGGFFQAKQLIFRDQIGSAWNYEDTELDARYFWPTPLEGAWGMAAYWEGVRGDAPFDRDAMPDGVVRLRGLEKGRLRDRQQLVAQGEWRVPLFWRFSVASFVEAGKVGPYASELMRNDFHYAYGVGGRLTLNKQRKVNVRGDLAWVDGGIGMTIYYKEAF